MVTCIFFKNFINIAPFLLINFAAIPYLEKERKCLVYFCTETSDGNTTSTNLQNFVFFSSYFKTKSCQEMLQQSSFEYFSFNQKKKPSRNQEIPDALPCASYKGFAPCLQLASPLTSNSNPGPAIDFNFSAKWVNSENINTVKHNYF